MGPKKPTKKELAEQKAEEERLAALAEEERLERERLEREEELKRLAEEKQQWLQAETQRMTEEKEEVAQHVVRREQLVSAAVLMARVVLGCVCRVGNTAPPEN